MIVGLYYLSKDSAATNDLKGNSVAMLKEEFSTLLDEYFEIGYDEMVRILYSRVLIYEANAML